MVITVPERLKEVKKIKNCTFRIGSRFELRNFLPQIQQNGISKNYESLIINFFPRARDLNNSGKYGLDLICCWALFTA